MSGRDEDLYREIEEQEDEDDSRYKQKYKMRELGKTPKREPDPVKAIKRFNEEIAPVLEARRRVQEGLPPTTNPFRNFYLKLTGQDQIVERPGFQMVEPSRGLVLDGPTVEEVQKQIAENPGAYKHLAKSAPEVQRIEAKRKGPEDLYRGD